MSGRPGIALLSFEHAHQLHWARAVASDPRVQIAGAWDASEERGRRIAEEIGVPWFADARELLTRDDVTAAILCNANGSKLEVMRIVAEAGKHVLVEKPPASKSEDVREMIQLVERSGITCVQSFPHRLVPNNQVVKQVLDAGELGRLSLMRKRHGHGFALKGLAQDMPWIVDQELGGGGALLDEGIHEMDLLRHYFGDPESVVAEVARSLPDLPVEDTSVIILRFRDGPLVELSSGWSWIAGGPATEVYGDAGTLLQFFTDCASNDAPDPAGAHLRLWRSGGNEWQEIGSPFPFSDIHQNMARHFIDVLVEGVPPVATLQDGLAAMQIAEGAYESAAMGSRFSFTNLGT